MATPLLTDLYRVLVGSQARPSATRVLRLLMTQTRAEAAALFAITPRGLSLFTSIAAGQELLDEAQAAFAANRLEAGQWASGTSLFVVLPDKTAVVALEAPREPKAVAESVRVVGPALVAAIQAMAATGKDSNGAMLLELLENNDWKIARVARELGVTRVTVYKRMLKHGIPRLRVKLSS